METSNKSNKGLSILIILVSILVIILTTIGTIMLLNKDDVKVDSEKNTSKEVQQSNNEVNKNESEKYEKNKLAACLKDEKWISENIMMKKSSFMNENKEYLDLQGEQTITCYKMNYITETIIYVVAESQEDLSKQLFVITYINGEVKVTPVTENSVHSEHNDFIFNKNIVISNFGNKGHDQYKYYIIEDGKVRLLSGNGVEKDANDNITYYELLNSNGEWVEVSKEEYNGYFEQEMEEEGLNYFDTGLLPEDIYEKFELTDSNVDKYILE